MKVYWTKSLKYDSINIIDDFCKKNNLIKEWQKQPKSHYVLIDTLDRDEIKQLVFNLVGEDTRVTSRSNKVAATAQAKAIIYNLIDEGIEADDLRESIKSIIGESEQKWGGEIHSETIYKYAESELERIHDYSIMIQVKAREIFKGTGKVVMVGAYESLNSRSKRLIELAEFLEGMIDRDCFIYDHKGGFFFITLNEDVGNLPKVLKFNNFLISKILGEDEVELNFNAHEFNESIYPMIRVSQGGGFLILDDMKKIDIGMYEKDVIVKEYNETN